MKPLTVMLPLTLALGGVVAALVFVWPMEPELRTSALIGALVSTLVGGLTMVIKTRFSGVGLEGMNSVKVALTGQALAFMVRILAVGGGAIALKQNGTLSPMAFVVSFMVISLGQQALETRSLLTARKPGKSAEVIS